MIAMKKINLTIDGKQIQAESGMTILEAALNARLSIPNSCYVPNIEPPVHECNLCVVEIDGHIDTACTVPVSDGMVVTTSNQELETMRRRRIHFPG